MAVIYQHNMQCYMQMLTLYVVIFNLPITCRNKIVIIDNVIKLFRSLKK